MNAKIKIRPYTQPSHGIRSKYEWVAEALSVDDPRLNFTMLGRKPYIENLRGYGFTKDEAAEDLKNKLKAAQASLKEQDKADAIYQSKVEHREIEV